MDTETTIAIQIQEQVFEDTGKKRKQELATIMCGLENWSSGGIRSGRKQEASRRGKKMREKENEEEGPEVNIVPRLCPSLHSIYLNAYINGAQNSSLLLTCVVLGGKYSNE